MIVFLVGPPSTELVSYSYPPSPSPSLSPTRQRHTPPFPVITISPASARSVNSPPNDLPDGEQASAEIASQVELIFCQDIFYAYNSSSLCLFSI